MQLASVILDIPTRALDAPYTYLVPESGCTDALELAVGCAVLVPFGNRKAVGFVVDLRDTGDAISQIDASFDSKKLKAIERVLSKPYFDEGGVACAMWLSERYIAPLSSCVRLFTPPGGVGRMVRARSGYWYFEEPRIGEVDVRWVVPGEAFDSFTPKKNAVKQAAIVEALRAGEVRVTELATEFGAVSAALKSLEKQNVVRIEHRRRLRGVSTSVQLGNTALSSTSVSAADLVPESAPATVPVPSPAPVTSRLALTKGQAQALAVIEHACAAGRGEVVLVDGVTGSGKTEVYLRAIEKVLAQGRTACVLVPEISLTPQTVARFRGRFGDTVAVMHSRMSQGERYDQWDFIRSGDARVVVGARSALFTPLKNIGLIVIDEEHEGSYKQESTPRYHARDVAIYMARRAGAAVVLGSATPSIESLYACEHDELWHRVELPERANGKTLPHIEVINMANEFKSGSRSMFSGRLARALQEELSCGRKAVLLLNQRGFAKFLLCRDCGFVPECPSCSTSLTYHEKGNALICHHCGYRKLAPRTCPSCGSPYLKKFGAGTQRVEAELRVLLDEMPGVGKDVPIIRMDADTTSKKGAHQRLLEEFASADAAVLLGTQMIAKGLDFQDVTLVGVINADTQLHLPDYRASERTFDLIEQVAGRAGRAELAGRVLVQTYEATSRAIQAAATYDRELFLRDELPKRKLLSYPPFVRMANVLLWGKDAAVLKYEAESLAGALKERTFDFADAGWEVLPAGPCVLEKLRGTYRWHIVVKCPLTEDISALFLPVFRTRRAHAQVNVAVDIDPVSLL